MEWGLVDGVAPTSQFKQRVAECARSLAASSDRPTDAHGIKLNALNPTVSDDRLTYCHVDVQLDRDKRVATVS